MTTTAAPTNVVDSVARAVATRRADEAKQIAAAQQELEPVAACARELLSQIVAAQAETEPVFSKLRAFDFSEARRAVRNNSVLSERVRTIESARDQASMLLSSSVRDLAAVPERIASLEIRDLQPAIFYVADADRAGFPSYYPGGPGRIRLTVAGYRSVPRRLRELCAEAEATLGDLLRAFDPATLAER